LPALRLAFLERDAHPDIVWPLRWRRSRRRRRIRPRPLPPSGRHPADGPDHLAGLRPPHRLSPAYQHWPGGAPFTVKSCARTAGTGRKPERFPPPRTSRACRLSGRYFVFFQFLRIPRRKPALTLAGGKSATTSPRRWKLRDQAPEHSGRRVCQLARPKRWARPQPSGSSPARTSEQRSRPCSASNLLSVACRLAAFCPTCGIAESSFPPSPWPVGQFFLDSRLPMDDSWMSAMSPMVHDSESTALVEDGGVPGADFAGPPVGRPLRRPVAGAGPAARGRVLGAAVPGSNRSSSASPMPPDGSLFFHMTGVH